MLPNKFNLYKLLLIIEIGFILPKIGIFLSKTTLILGPIIPDKREKNRTITTAIVIFAFSLFLLEAPINIPRAVPKRLPSIIKNTAIFKLI